MLQLRTHITNCLEQNVFIDCRSAIEIKKGINLKVNDCQNLSAIHIELNKCM